MKPAIETVKRELMHVKPRSRRKIVLERDLVKLVANQLCKEIGRKRRAFKFN